MWVAGKTVFLHSYVPCLSALEMSQTQYKALYKSPVYFYFPLLLSMVEYFKQTNKIIQTKN